jgi:predicted small lipoprotein YifL
MKRSIAFFIVALFILSAVSCGKKGPLLPPLVKIPQSPEEVKAVQRGNEILLTWKNPQAYKDGSPLSCVSEVEIWLFKEKQKNEEKRESLKKEDFEKTAERIYVIAEDKFLDYLPAGGSESPEFLYHYFLKEGDFALERFIFGLRVKDQRGKTSEFSSLAAVEPRILPFPPENVRVSVHEEGIEVLWSQPEKKVDQSAPSEIKGYNIYRSEGENRAMRINPDLVGEEKFNDKDFRFGVEYRYFIRASLTDSAPFLESSDSEVAEVLAEDTFAPDPPLGLMAVAGREFISLSWESSQERDLEGYRVWRKEEGEEDFTLLTPQPIQETTYSDTAVEKNRRYYYAITALDTAGNESPRSENVSEIIEDVPA